MRSSPLAPFLPGMVLYYRDRPWKAAILSLGRGQRKWKCSELEPKYAKKVAHIIAGKIQSRETDDVFCVPILY